MGVEDHIQEWPELTSVARDRAGRDLTREDLARVQGWLEQAYAPERLRSEIENALLAEASASRFSALAEVASSPALARHRERVGRQQGIEGLALQPARMARVMARGLAPRRALAVHRLSAATGQSRNLLAVALSIGEAIARAHQGLLCREPAEVSNAAELQRQEIASASRDFESHVMHLLNLAYWDASDQEVAEIVSAMESPEPRWFYARLSVHLDEALRLSEAELTNRVTEMREVRCPTE